MLSSDTKQKIKFEGKLAQLKQKFSAGFNANRLDEIYVNLI
jgi:hypothetical protein